MLTKSIKVLESLRFKLFHIEYQYNVEESSFQQAIIESAKPVIQDISDSTTSGSTSTGTSISESTGQQRLDSQYSHVNPMRFPIINNAQSLPVPN